MQKYLFIIPSLSKGGAERVVSILASELTKNNREAVIVTHFIANMEYPVNKKVKVICLSKLNETTYRKNITIPYLLKLTYLLRKVIAKENPDYILPFLWTTCIRTDIALMLSPLKKRVIQTVRNNPNIFPKNVIVKKYRDYLIKRSNLTIVQNTEQQQYFPLKWRKKIKVLPNPVSKGLFEVTHKESSNDFLIVAVGRLEEQKNFKLLIDSVAEVYKKYSNVKLNIFGEGSLKNELQKEIDLLNMKDIINLRGRSNDYSEIYVTASAFVLSSNYEGMPNTLLEAMAVGLPCISTDCPSGPSDIIQPLENGILIPVQNKEMLCSSIELLIRDNKLKKKLGQMAKKTIKENYLPEKIVFRLMEICEG